MVALRHAVFDGYQRAFPRERQSAPAVIVEIDERALALVGQWPWPRTRVAELISKIAAAQPAAIGVDVLFPEPDRFSPASIAESLPEQVAARLRQLPTNDVLLGRAIRGRKVVLGFAGLEAVDPRFQAPPQAAPFRVRVTGELPVRHYAGHLQSVTEVDAAAAGRGLLSADPEQRIVRRAILFARVHDSWVPSLAAEMVRVATSSAAFGVADDGGDDLALFIGNVAIPVQRDGTLWLHYGPHDPQRFVSAADVLAGKTDPELLQGKLALIGVTGLGLLDYQATPLGERMPGVEIHAQLLEQIFDGRYLRRPPDALWLEGALLLASGLLLIAIVPTVRVATSIALYALVIAMLAALGVAGFRIDGVLMDVAWPAIGASAVFVAVLAGTLAEADRQRRQLREQAARVTGEFESARRIQAGLLPDPKKVFAAEARFSLEAHLQPARTVGGDFYDCFMVDSHRLFFVVADVSGKGLAASLFMALSKSLLKSTALRGGDDPGTILVRASAEIARDNTESLFVTAFAGMLDARTGNLDYCNAGHEPPFGCRPGRALERLEHSGGPPLCVVADYTYPSENRSLAVGEWLCVVTDGVTEAMNESGALYGAERLHTLLAGLPETATPAEISAAVREGVRRFVGRAEPSDDLTLLCLRWNGSGAAALRSGEEEEEFADLDLEGRLAAPPGPSGR